MTDAPRTQIIHDVMDPARTGALNTALNATGLAPDDTTRLHPFYHHIYFWDAHPPVDLGRDGHPKLGGLIPDMGLPRRMWAGGRLQFHRDVVLSIPAEKRLTLQNMVEKTGRSGRLAFATVQHDIVQNGQVCMNEFQDVVYREDPAPGAPPPPPPVARGDETLSIAQRFDTTLLFRYSALTFNGHRIHYDRDYATGVEGYPGLIVHGPLLAQLLVLLARRELGPLATFEFRATAPLFDHEVAELCMKDDEFWVRGPDNRLCMSARATPA